MSRKYDIVAVTGSYTDRSGQEKKRYENVGSVMQGEKGPYIIMRRTFNPAGIKAREGSDSIFLNLFEPKSKQEQPQESRQAADFDDDVPF